MPDDLNLIVVGIFLASVIAVVGLGLAIIALVMRADRVHRRRLARVGRKRMGRRLDLDDARMMLLRQRKQSTALDGLSNALAKVIPLLDTGRLRANILRAGLGWSVGTFIAVSLVAGCLLLGGLVLLAPGSLALWALPALFGGMLLVDNYVKLRGASVANKFMRQLPDAIDAIIRGIRSGLPVIECVGTVGQEFPEPIGPYFQSVSERVQLGEPLETALWRVARVVGKPEMDFFAISIAIQMETGGSLAEALGNLADLLRKRAQMKLKIKAISSEAKASAIIIGALPFAMMGLLMFMSPEYVMPLFTDPRGNVMLVMGLGSIGVGAFVMWRMTQFEI